MDIKDFYTLDSKLSSSTVQVHSIGLEKVQFEDNMAAEWHLISADYGAISFPIVFKQKYGNKLEDILNTGWPSLLLISSKLKKVLEENNLIGWKTFDVKVLNKQDAEIPGYYGFSITGRCGKIDYEKSEIIEKRLVPNGPLVKYYKGLNVGVDKWDGSDFFLPEKSFGIITTSKTWNALKKNQLTNIRLKNLAEIETSVLSLPNS